MKHSVRNSAIFVLIVVLALTTFGAAAAGSNPQRPFKAHSFEVVTSEGIIEGSACPAFEVNSAGSGTGTHIGRFTVVRRHCFTPPRVYPSPRSQPRSNLYPPRLKWLFTGWCRKG